MTSSVLYSTQYHRKHYTLQASVWSTVYTQLLWQISDPHVCMYVKQSSHNDNINGEVFKREGNACSYCSLPFVALLTCFHQIMKTMRFHFQLRAYQSSGQLKPANNRYPIYVLIQCWVPVADSGPAFKQHCCRKFSSFSSSYTVSVYDNMTDCMVWAAMAYVQIMSPFCLKW